MQNPEHASMLSYTYISCLALEIQGLCDFVSGKICKNQKPSCPFILRLLVAACELKETTQIGARFSRIFVVCVCVCVCVCARARARAN